MSLIYPIIISEWTTVDFKNHLKNEKKKLVSCQHNENFLSNQQGCAASPIKLQKHQKSFLRKNITKLMKY